MSNEQAPGWVVPVMRFGYSARGVVYIIVGGLAVLAAWRGGSAEGTTGALQTLKGEPWGYAALWIIAIGLFAYAVWRLIDAWMDLEDYGTGLKGIVARTGQVVTGLIHAALGAATIRLALGDSSGEGGGTQTLASKVLAMENGALIMMAIGLVTIGAGLYYGYKGLAEKYKAHLRRTATTERLDPAIKAGLLAHGAVIVLIGGFLFYAGQTTDPGQAGGMGQAFETVRAQPFGRVLLALLGLGMLGFALYCLVEAIYRVVPRAAGGDVATLATRVRARAEGELRRAAARAP